jgi:hypothetical protein
MFDTSAEQSRRWPPATRDFLLVVVVVAIIVMPFVAGRHPSGGQTVLVLAASFALAVISMALLRYGGQSEQRTVQRRVADWPAPDTPSATRHRPRRGSAPNRNRAALDEEFVVEQRG